MKKITIKNITGIAKTRARSGYVLLATLMLIALGIAVISTVVQRALSYQRIMRVALEREKARMLALGGLQIALAQVSFITSDEQEQEQKKQQDQLQDKQDKTEKPTEEQDKLNADQRWLLQLLPVINTWQQFAFTQEKDKLEGAVSVYISSEQGKFDLVSLLDVPLQSSPDSPPEASPEVPVVPGELSLPASKNKASHTPGNTGNAGTSKDASKDKKEKEQFKNFINEQVSRRVPDIKLVDIAQQVQKQLGRRLEDATELTKDKRVQEAFQDRLFTPEKKQESKDDKMPVYLTDIFTTRSRSGKLNPWLISSSVGALLEFQVKDRSDMQKWQQAVKQWQPKVNWSSAWDKIFKDIYGKAYQALPQALRDNLNSEFEATAFLAVSSATVGSVTQTVAALMQKSDFLSQASAQHTVGSSAYGSFGATRQPRKPQSRIFALTKLYWL